MKRYFNIKTCYGIETVDEISRCDFTTYKDYKDEMKRLVFEYRDCGMNVYISQRCDKNWKK